MPSSPRNSLSPAEWHGLRRNRSEGQRSRRGSTGAAGPTASSKYRASRLTALASPRSPSYASSRRRAPLDGTARDFGSAKALVADLDHAAGVGAAPWYPWQVADVE